MRLPHGHRQENFGCISQTLVCEKPRRGSEEDESIRPTAESVTPKLKLGDLNKLKKQGRHKTFKSPLWKSRLQRVGAAWFSTVPHRNLQFLLDPSRDTNSLATI